jgi:DNA-binding NarL/FixJ family response regulator
VLLTKSNREIALQLGIEERTVKAHMARLMKKMGAENRMALSIQAAHRDMGAQRSEGAIPG